MRRPDPVQFAQRIAAAFHLPAMDAPTVAQVLADGVSFAAEAPPAGDPLVLFARARPARTE